MQEKKYTRDELLGKQPPSWAVGVATVGLLAIVVGTLVPLLRQGFDGMWYRYVFAAGAVLVLAGRLFSPYTGKHMRLKRVNRLESWSGIFFCVAAFFMFYDPSSNRDWLAFTLAGGAIQIVSTILSTRILNKELKK